MEIKDVNPNTGNVDVVVEVVSKDEPRTFEKFGKSGRVCNATIRDASGELKLTLWNDDIDQVRVGDKIHIQNGWCSEYKGERQLSTGKFGKIEIVEKRPEGVLTNDPGILAREMGEESEESEEDVEGIDEEFID
ncbi:MAG: OB-fold nucleic acid binding domain-containing protein [archaeon]|nr:OB-fold nucleic acid binding domain-containing protein [archaeon]